MHEFNKFVCIICYRSCLAQTIELSNQLLQFFPAEPTTDCLNKRFPTVEPKMGFGRLQPKQSSTQKIHSCNIHHIIWMHRTNSKIIFTFELPGFRVFAVKWRKNIISVVKGDDDKTPAVYQMQQIHHATAKRTQSDYTYHCLEAIAEKIFNRRPFPDAWVHHGNQSAPQLALLWYKEILLSIWAISPPLWLVCAWHLAMEGSVVNLPI